MVVSPCSCFSNSAGAKKNATATGEIEGREDQARAQAGEVGEQQQGHELEAHQTDTVDVQPKTQLAALEIHQAEVREEEEERGDEPVEDSLGPDEERGGEHELEREQHQQQLEKEREAAKAQAQREAAIRARLLESQQQDTPNRIAAQSDELWFLCTAKAIAVRPGPDINAPKSDVAVFKGEKVAVRQKLRKHDENVPWGQTYLELADGRGWIFDTRPGSDEKVMEQQQSDRNVHASSNVVTKLEHYKIEVDSMERQLEEIEIKLADGIESTDPYIAKAKGELAQLHGSVEHMQCSKIDAVELGGLAATGKEEARAMRKQLTRRCEQLDGRIGVASGLLVPR